MRRIIGNRQGGFTLVELMVSMVILGIAISATLALGTSILSGYRTNRSAITTERSARIALEWIADAVRNASPGVPNGDIEDLVGCRPDPGDPGRRSIDGVPSATGPDELLVITAAGGAITSLWIDYDAVNTPAVMTVVDGSEFRPGDYLVVTSVAQGSFVRINPADGSVTQIGPGHWEMAIETFCAGTVDEPATATYPTATAGTYEAGALVIRARMAQFAVRTIPQLGNVPTLTMDPDGPSGPADFEPLAEGIEDFQFAVGIDVDGDGTVFEDGTTLDEWFFNAPGDIFPPPPSVIRALRITLVSRSTLEVSKSPVSYRPPIEDRPGAGMPDEFRRRVLSTVVEIRNVTGSP